LRKASVDALDAAGTDLTRVTTRACAGTIADTADIGCETWWLVPEIAFCVPQRPNPFSATRGGCVGVLRPGNAFAVRRLRQVANPKKVAPCQKACNALPACTEATFAVVPRRRGEGNHDTVRVRSGGMAVRFLRIHLYALCAPFCWNQLFGSSLQSKGGNRHPPLITRSLSQHNQLSTSSHRLLCPANSYPMSATLVGTPRYVFAAFTN
jgi:hypothetical protein